MINKTRFILLMMLLLIAIPSLQAQDKEGLVLVDIQVVEDMGDDIDSLAVLSPDATTLAWISRDREFCLYGIDNGSMDCIGPVDAPFRRGSPLIWSPDGRYIATHEDLVRALDESDIWVLDVQNREIINLTDDGVDTDTMRDQTILALDNAPMWDPVTGDLYFIRNLRVSGNFTANLFRISRVDGALDPDTATAVTTFSQFEDPLPFYQITPTTLQGTGAISPDGTTAALLGRTPGFRDPLDHSILLVDLATGDISTLATFGDFAAIGKPDWYIDENGAYGSDTLDGLAWSDDNQHVMVSIINGIRGQESLGTAYSIDVTSGEAAAMIDFSAVEDEDAVFLARGSDGNVPMYDVMRQTILLPGTDQIAYFNQNPNIQEGVGLSVVSITGNELPMRLATGTISDGPIRGLSPLSSPSAGANETVVRIVIYGNLFTFLRTDDATGISTIFEVPTEYTPLEIIMESTDGPTLTDITSISPMSDFMRPRPFAYFSGDGTAIIKIEARSGEVCTYIFDTQTGACQEVALPNDVGNQPLIWSPDNSRAIIAEDSIPESNDAGLWLYEPETASFTDLTDSGFTGMSPVWHPATGDLYYIQTIVGSTHALVRLPADDLSAEPEAIAALDLPADYFVYADAVNSYGLLGSSAISPDGSHIALLSRPADLNTRTAHSVNVVNLSDGTMATFDLGALKANGIAWSADNQTVILSEISGDRFNPVGMLHALNTGDGALTLIGGGSAGSTVTPDGSLMFFLGETGAQPSHILTTISLPDLTTVSEIAVEMDHYVPYPRVMLNSARVMDGQVRVAFDGVIFTFAR